MTSQESVVKSMWQSYAHTYSCMYMVEIMVFMWPLEFFNCLFWYIVLLLLACV